MVSGKKLFLRQQKVLNEANEYFEELKKDEQEKREEREAAWAEQELSVKILDCPNFQNICNIDHFR